MLSKFGLPDILHSDQGRNFESTLLKQTLDAFGIQNTRTTAYHPQWDGMGKQFNRSLLQLLRVYMDNEADWERYLPLILPAYHTFVHSSTGISPFMLMFGRQPKQPIVSSQNQAYGPASYQAQVTCKMAKMRDLVETQLVHSAAKQRSSYHKHSKDRNLMVGDLVWLSIPTLTQNGIGGGKSLRSLALTLFQMMELAQSQPVPPPLLSQPTPSVPNRNRQLPDYLRF